MECLAGCVRPEGVEEPAEKRSPPGAAPPPKDKAHAAGRQDEREPDEEVEGGDRPERRSDRPTEHAEQRHGGVVGQIDTSRVVEEVRVEQRHAVTQRIRHPGEKPHHLVRIGSRRVASAGRGQLPGVEGPDRQVGQHHEDGVPEEAEEKRPSARRQPRAHELVLAHVEGDLERVVGQRSEPWWGSCCRQADHDSLGWRCRRRPRTTTIETRTSDMPNARNAELLAAAVPTPSTERGSVR